MRHLLLAGVICCVLLMAYVVAAMIMILRTSPSTWEPIALLVAVLLVGLSAFISLRFLRLRSPVVRAVSALHVVVAMVPALLFWSVTGWFLAETLAIAARGDPYYKLALYLGAVMGGAPALLATTVFVSVLVRAWPWMRRARG